MNSGKESTKMLLRVIIALLPILCDGKIKINITVASNIHDAIVKYSGQEVKVINENEVKLFNISMDNLNRGFRVELGKVPDGILLKDPTTYGNLFHKYKWPEVKRVLEVEKIEVIETINKEIDLITTEVANNCTDNVKSELALFDNVENRVYSTWSDKGMPVEETFYDVIINFEGSSFQYENKWRDNTLKSKIVKFGKSIKGNLTIKPGQTVVKKLIATKTIFVLKVDYTTKLAGNVVGDYKNLYGKYHFWAPTINNIMKAAKIPNEIRTSEKIEIRCYTDARLKIYDKDTELALPLKTKRRLYWKIKPNYKVTTVSQNGSELVTKSSLTTTLQTTTPRNKCGHPERSNRFTKKKSLHQNWRMNFKNCDKEVTTPKL